MVVQLRSLLYSLYDYLLYIDPFSGQYGAVYRATLIDHTSTSKTVIVAVKTIREHSQEEWIDLLQTVSILRNPHHPNIAEVFGAVPESEFILYFLHQHFSFATDNWIVMEYTALGDLKRHLIVSSAIYGYSLLSIGNGEFQVLYKLFSVHFQIEVNNDNKSLTSVHQPTFNVFLHL